MRHLTTITALVCTLAAAGCLPGGKTHATYSLGGGGVSGKAFLPTTAESRNLYSVRYRELGGGHLTRWILLIMSAPKGKTVTTVDDNCVYLDSSKSRVAGDCTITRTTRHYPPTKEEIAAWVPTARLLMNDALPVELNIVAHFGEKDDAGNARAGGWATSFLFRMPIALYGRSKMVELGFGYKYERITFRDVKHKVAVPGGGGLMAMDAEADFTYQNFGSPIRLSALIHPNASLYLQYDYNWFSFIGDDANHLYTSPLRVGVQMSIPGFKFAYGTLEGISDGGDAKRASIMAEVGLVW